MIALGIFGLSENNVAGDRWRARDREAMEIMGSEDREERSDRGRLFGAVGPNCGLGEVGRWVVERFVRLFRRSSIRPG